MSKDKFEQYLIDEGIRYKVQAAKASKKPYRERRALEAAKVIGSVRIEYAKIQQERSQQKKIWLISGALTVFVALLIGSCAAKADVQVAKAREFYLKRTVRILRNNTQIGSGAAIGPKQILTAAHVCDAMPDGVSTPGSRFNKITRIASGNPRLIDVCILTLKNLHRAPEVSLAKDFSVLVGTRVVISGYTGDHLFILSGLVVEIGPMGKFFGKGPAILYRVNRRAYPGQSGGPIFNSEGKLVGIVTSYVRDHYVYHMLFTSIREIRAFYTRMGLANNG